MRCIKSILLPCDKFFEGMNKEVHQGREKMREQPDGKERLKFFGHALLITETESLLRIFQVFVSVPDIQDP